MAEALAVLRRDPGLRRVIEEVGPLELRARRPYFWTLCRAILAQQVSNAAARSITARVRELVADRRHPDPASILRTPEAALRAAGVSRQKARYLHALAQAFGRGELSRVRFARLSDDEIIERLTAVLGIGRWTAEMFLIFSMRRSDIFPIDDLGIRRGMERLFRLKELDAMVRRTARWRPYRTVASLYLWRAGAALPP